MTTLRSTSLAAIALFAPLPLHAQHHASTPCALITDAQIKAVLNSPTLPGQPTNSPDKAECTWKDAKGETRVYLSVKDAGIEYKAFRDQMQATGKMVPITGLAEDAFYIASSGASAALYALKSKHLVLITVDGVGFSRAENEAAEKGLITQLLPRL